ncbi:MAG: XTP/dITP diphosphatase [Candidatus Marinimicrobia bacterium]|nr:XTP/dITP diphosphatase [Candidatus Neomarinimicrobiota bacterium]
MEILISSNNKDKVKEIKKIFDNKGIRLLTLADFPGAPEVIEDGNTLYDNAFKKAKLLFDFTGIPTIADDTGLEVDALDGAPGVYSARYAGENVTYDDNVNKLLKELEKVADEKRTARFKTVAVYYSDQHRFHEEGSCEGIILRERRGTGGFGYDPVFYLKEYQKSFAEMRSEEKNTISHRGIAFQKLYHSFINQVNQGVSP